MAKTIHKIEFEKIDMELKIDKMLDLIVLKKEKWFNNIDQIISMIEENLNIEQLSQEISHKIA